MTPKPLRVLMILENNSYFSDVRVRSEAESLSANGYCVSVICPRDPAYPAVWQEDNIRVYGIPVRSLFKGTLAYLWEYASFLAVAQLYTLYLGVREPFDIIHAHNPPDLIFLGALPWKLLGKRFVFDHHDLSPETFAFRFNKTSGWVYRTLVWAERMSCQLADLVIASNESIKKIEVERAGTHPNNICVVRNGPNLSQFAPERYPSSPNGGTENHLIAFVGRIGPTDGVQYLLRALACIVHQMGRQNVRCRIIGSGDALDDLRALAVSLNIGDRVEFTGWMSDKQQMLKLLSEAEVCVEPAPVNDLNQQLTMIKIMEYMALAKPIVAFDLKETHVSAQDTILYASANDPEDMARKIVTLLDQPEMRRAMGLAARERVVNNLAWEFSARALVSAYSRFGAEANGSR